MIYINITSFVLISWLEKDCSMIETRCLKNVIFFQTMIIMSSSSLVLSFTSTFCFFPVTLVKWNNNKFYLAMLIPFSYIDILLIWITERNWFPNWYNYTIFQHNNYLHKYWHNDMIWYVTNTAPVISVSSVTLDNKPHRLPLISIIIYHVFIYAIAT